MFNLSILDMLPFGEGQSAEEAVQDCLLLAQAAESMGYKRFWISEHHNDQARICASPEVLLPYLACNTKTIRLGTGGVLLNFYSALKVAEQFRMLEAIFPGRVDLGLGRAYGAVGKALAAIRYGMGERALEVYPDTVQDLLYYLGRESIPDSHPFRDVYAVPPTTTVPDVWMLASSPSSAQIAADLGCGLVFAAFIDESQMAHALQIYRGRFKPSTQFPEPKAIIGVSVICADTDAQAEDLAWSRYGYRVNEFNNINRPMPNFVESKSRVYGKEDMELIGLLQTKAILGTPEKVRSSLEQMVENTLVEEIMLTIITPDFTARMNTLELVAESMKVRA